MMDKATFDEIIEAERLGRWLVFDRPSGTLSNRVCVFRSGGVWRRVITDERAGVLEGSRREFTTEDAALADALITARVLKDLLNFGS